MFCLSICYHNWYQCQLWLSSSNVRRAVSHLQNMLAEMQNLLSILNFYSCFQKLTLFKCKVLVYCNMSIINYCVRTTYQSAWFHNNIDDFSGLWLKRFCFFVFFSCHSHVNLMLTHNLFSVVFFHLQCKWKAVRDAWYCSCICWWCFGGYPEVHSFLRHCVCYMYIM